MLMEKTEGLIIVWKLKWDCYTQNEYIYLVCRELFTLRTNLMKRDKFRCLTQNINKNQIILKFWKKLTDIPA